MQYATKMLYMDSLFVGIALGILWYEVGYVAPVLMAFCIAIIAFVAGTQFERVEEQ